MRKAGAMLFVFGLLIAMSSLAAAESNVEAETTTLVPQVGDAVTPVTFSLTFQNASQVFNFAVAASGNGKLTVDTMDCCIEGDSWGVTVRPKPIPFTLPFRKPTCGTGSITQFSGAVNAFRVSSATVQVSYCGGTDIFPAGMTVRFQFSGSSLTVTPQ